MKDNGLTLRVSGLSKSFPGVKALDKAQLEVRKGEIHVVMGENGAGKSTLMKVLAGVYTADEGTIWLEGKEISVKSPLDAIGYGINLIYQELSVAPNLTVAENIFMGSEIQKYHLVNKQAMIQKSQEVLDRLGAGFKAGIIAGNLSIAEQQQIEIARALIHDSKVLIMDEPTAALSDRETERLFEVVMNLKEQGISIIYISHRINEVTRIADRVSVMRDGQYIGTLDKHEIDSERVVSMMVGRPLDDFYKHEINTNIRRGVLKIENFSDGKSVKDIHFDVGAGEILGLSGLVGAGRTELSRMIFGIDKKESGHLYLNGEAITINHPADAIKQNIGYVPEDRKLQGLFLDMSVAENTAINILDELSVKGIISHDYNSDVTDKYIDEMNIKVSEPSVRVQKLSGGNQQKVLLARWLAINPQVLILDEPTRGVDVGAKSEIYKLIGHLASQGVAVIFISSELPEIVGICQRVLVMREGLMVGEITKRSEITQQNIMAYATGVKSPDYSYTKEG